MTPRSWLYVPALPPERLERATTRGADALIVDLEDAIAPAMKATARQTVAAWLADAPPGPQVWVRLNRGADGLLDAESVLSDRLDGLCLPKVETVEEIEAVHAVAAASEARSDERTRSVRICPLIESAIGWENLPALVRASRVSVVQIGEVDLCADLGVTPAPGGLELLSVRSDVVRASRAAELAAPVAAVCVDYEDMTEFRAETLMLARLGFVGRACIHPAQVEVVNEVFSVSAAEYADARRIIDAFERAQLNGQGATSDGSRRVMDAASIRAARRLLDRC